MMKFYINRQEEYSRGYLILRAFFGMIYIAIPHIFLIFFLQIGAGFINMITFWIILFTGKYPDWSWNYNVKLLRYSLRVNAALSNLTDIYPEFGLGGSHPEMDFDLAYQENQSRGTLILRALFGGLMLIPHNFLLIFMGIAASFVGMIAFWAILFTGKYPEGMFNFVVRIWRWQYRVTCWSLFLTADYPKFTGEVLEGENQGGGTEQESVVEQTEVTYKTCGSCNGSGKVAN